MMEKTRSMIRNFDHPLSISINRHITILNPDVSKERR